jgi:hypothetical protein
MNRAISGHPLDNLRRPMKSKHATSSSEEFNPYAPPSTLINEPVIPNVLPRAEPLSRSACATSMLLGCTSIILNLFEVGLFAFVPLVLPPRTSSGIMPPGLLAVVFGCLGLATVVGCLGLWLVRAQLKVCRSTQAEAMAVRFCRGGLVATGCNVLVINIFILYNRIT